jgi:ferredoxin-NADP reductase
MEEHIVRILYLEQVTRDVRRFRVEKPEGYSFIPGQATEISVNTPELMNKKGPWTFTSRNSDPWLEFTIKLYPQRLGKTYELSKLNVGDELIIRDVWGTIAYKGKGVFIAGGAGVTPFIAILRDLESRNEVKGNRLLFANRTKEDIINEAEFRRLLGEDFINILSEEQAEGFEYGFVDENFLSRHITDFSEKFYVCGPPPMMKTVLAHLNKLGVSEDSIITEK